MQGKAVKSLQAFAEKKCLINMSKQELAYLPKEVMIACASEEIVYVFHKLPKKLQEDPDLNKYLYCTDHYNNQADDEDVIDGPPPRKIFCCYCSIKEITMASENKIKVSKHPEGYSKCDML